MQSTKSMLMAPPGALEDVSDCGVKKKVDWIVEATIPACPANNGSLRCKEKIPKLLEDALMRYRPRTCPWKTEARFNGIVF